jgi:hypothetical protein
MVFKMEVWKSTLLAEIYKEQKQLWGVRKRTEQGLGGSGQNALEKMKEIENK